MPMVCSHLRGKGNRTQCCSSRVINVGEVNPGPHLRLIREQTATSLTCPPRHQFLGRFTQMTSDLKLSKTGVSDWHSGKAASSGTAWPSFPQIPTLPWVFRHLPALRPFGYFTVHLFKVFETPPAEQLRL